MFLSYIDLFTAKFLVFIHLIFLMFFLVYISGRFFSILLNEVFFWWEDKKNKKK